MPGHLQSTAQVLLSKVLNPEMLKLDPAMTWQLIQGWTLPSPIVCPPHDPGRDEVANEDVDLLVLFMLLVLLLLNRTLKGGLLWQQSDWDLARSHVEEE